MYNPQLGLTVEQLKEGVGAAVERATWPDTGLGHPC